MLCAGATTRISLSVRRLWAYVEDVAHRHYRGCLRCAQYAVSWRGEGTTWQENPRSLASGCWQDGRRWILTIDQGGRTVSVKMCVTVNAELVTMRMNQRGDEGTPVSGRAQACGAPHPRLMIAAETWGIDQ